MTDPRVTVVHLKSKVLSSPWEGNFFIFGGVERVIKYPTQIQSISSPSEVHFFILGEEDNQGRQGQANLWILQAISPAQVHMLCIKDSFRVMSWHFECKRSDLWYNYTNQYENMSI